MYGGGVLPSPGPTPMASSGNSITSMHEFTGLTITSGGQEAARIS